LTRVVHGEKYDTGRWAKDEKMLAEETYRTVSRVRVLGVRPGGGRLRRGREINTPEEERGELKQGCDDPIKPKQSEKIQGTRDSGPRTSMTLTSGSSGGLHPLTDSIGKMTAFNKNGNTPGKKKRKRNHGEAAVE